MILIKSVNVCDIFYHGSLIEFLTSRYPVKIALGPIKHKTMSNPKNGNYFCGWCYFSRVSPTVSVAFITSSLRSSSLLGFFYFVQMKVK